MHFDSTLNQLQTCTIVCLWRYKIDFKDWDKHAEGSDHDSDNKAYYYLFLLPFLQWSRLLFYQ